ncbi:MAG: DUF4037 domain-containing protein [Clostridia bacterium]|nr:DUF4037 domain-containing protein [Clostridia bacterium]
MNGIELARAFWEKEGLPMMERDFPDLLPRVAVGLAGSGSECLGFDDEISRDHDFEPGFCLFLPGEDAVSRREEFLLERAYAKLPREFAGFRRSGLSPVGGNRHGPIRAALFWTEKLGVPTGVLSPENWLSLPDYALAEAAGGAVFRDDSGFFTRVRAGLKPPADVVSKKLAAQFFLMGQAGQYNLPRCLARGEKGAAALAADAFVRAALFARHLLAGVFEPYYKWAFRSLRRLPGGGETEKSLLTVLSVLTAGPEAQGAVETVCRETASLARERDPALPDTAEMEKLAWAQNDRIASEGIRNLHLLYTVRD